MQSNYSHCPHQNEEYICYTHKSYFCKACLKLHEKDNFTLIEKVAETSVEIASQLEKKINDLDIIIERFVRNLNRELHERVEDRMSTLLEKVKHEIRNLHGRTYEHITNVAHKINSEANEKRDKLKKIKDELKSNTTSLKKEMSSKNYMKVLNIRDTFSDTLKDLEDIQSELNYFTEASIGEKVEKVTSAAEDKILKELEELRSAIDKSLLDYQDSFKAPMLEETEDEYTLVENEKAVLKINLPKALGWQSSVKNIQSVYRSEKFPVGFAQCVVNSKWLYSSGGVYPMNSGSTEGSSAQDEELLCDLVQYDINTKSLMKKSPMNHERKYHVMIELNTESLIAVGGHSGVYPLNSCEVYSMKENKWEEISSMKAGRMLPTVFTLDKNTVYVVGGELSKSKNKDTIEKCVLSADFKGKWEVIVANAPEISFSSMGYLIFSKDEVILFGGENAKGNLSKKCIKFNRSTNKLEDTNINLEVGAKFRTHSIAKQINFFSIMDDTGKNIHIFDKKQWALKEVKIENVS